MARILVTGAGGLIGRALCDRLAREGHRVRGLLRAASDAAALSGIDAEVVRGDVTDRSSLDRACAGMEIVVHAAGRVSDWGPYERFFAANVTGTQHAAEAAAHAGVRRFVHISSTAIHGFGGYRHADEDAPCPPSRFAYVETKRLAEEWLFAFGRSTPMEVTAIRPGNVFGPRDRSFVETYADALRSGRGGYVSGGHSWTCPTYVENLARAIALACVAPAAAGEAIIVTDGLPIDWRSFTETLAAAIGARAPRLSLPFGIAYPIAAVMEACYLIAGASAPPPLTRYRILNAARDYHFSIAKAQRLLGWAPEVGFEEAIRRTAAWYCGRADSAPSAALNASRRSGTSS